MTGAETTWQGATEPRWNRLLLAGFVVSILILVGTAGISTWNHQQLVSTGREVARTHLLLRQIAEFSLRLLEVRNTDRALLLPGQNSSLELFRHATNRLAELLPLMREHLEGDPLQQPRCAQLSTTLKKVLSALRTDTATEVIKPDLDSLRSIVVDISQEELRQLAERETVSSRAERVAFWFNNSGRVLSILLFSGVFFGLLRENQLRRQREAELRQSGAELERRVVERTAELAEKNKELETVVYVVSHDLRSPLLNIQGFARRLDRACHGLQELASASQDGVVPVSNLKPPLDETIPQALGFIEAGVRRMDQLLTGFLRYSRLGRVALNIAPLDMNELLAGVLQSMKFQIEQTQAGLGLEPLPRCLGDATQTAQVFFNLLDNALKYRDPARPLRITVRGHTDGDRSVYSVSDNGLGIAPEHQPKIFEIFHRLSPEQTPGEGLGLTIAQRILERQGGKIWVESRLGTGSTFFVALPKAPESG